MSNDIRAWVFKTSTGNKYFSLSKSVRTEIDRIAESHKMTPSKVVEYQVWPRYEAWLKTLERELKEIR